MCFVITTNWVITYNYALLVMYRNAGFGLLFCTILYVLVVSFVAVFVMSHNASPKEGEHCVTKAAKETNVSEVVRYFELQVHRLFTVPQFFSLIPLFSL